MLHNLILPDKCNIIYSAIQAGDTMKSLFLKYWAHQLTLQGENGNISDLAATLNTARIDMHPYQISAVNDCLLSLRENNGVILADEVGLGKTIETGLIISKLCQSGKRRILIITPPGLIEQWDKELTEKFHFNVRVTDGSLMRKKKPPNPFITRKANEILICSYHFASNKFKDLSMVPFDLCCIDEAHNLRNPQGKRSSNIKTALKHVPKVLITATPIQNNREDLYSLVRMIDQYFPIVSKKSCDPEELWKPLLVRKLRKDSDVNYTERITMTINFESSDSEKDLYHAVETFFKGDKLHCMKEGNRALVRMTLRRLLASCPSNLATTLNRLKKRLEHISEMQKPLPKPNSSMSKKQLEKLEELSKQKRRFKIKLTDAEREQIKSEIEELETLRSRALKIEDNSKSEALIYILREGLKRVEENGGARKAVIFTEYLETQQHIAELLKTVPDLKVVLINGSNKNPQAERIYRQWLKRNKPPRYIEDDPVSQKAYYDWKKKYGKTSRYKKNPNIDRKTALLEYFEKHADILIATDAASEGLNLQFCSLLINYDLPWNPQRIEQRIGRCHRYGQKNDVVVVNFMNLYNYAEKRLLKILTPKLEVFKDTLKQSNEILDLQSLDDKTISLEKWAEEVFRKCRSREEIEQAFAEKDSQKPVEDDIKSTEHFNPDLDSIILRNREKIWELFKYSYAKSGKFSDNTMSVHLKRDVKKTRDNGKKISIRQGKYTIHPDCKRRGCEYLNPRSPVIETALRDGRKITLSGIKKTSLKFSIPENVRLSSDIPLSTYGAVRVILAKCKSYYGYDKLIYAGYYYSGKYLYKMPEDSLKALLECPYKPVDTNRKFYTGFIRSITANIIAEANKFLQGEFERHLEHIDENMDKALREKQTQLKHELDLARRNLQEAQSSKSDHEKKLANIKFEQTWHQYNNDLAEFRHRHNITVLQTKKDHAPNINTETLFTIHWET